MQICTHVLGTRHSQSNLSPEVSQYWFGIMVVLWAPGTFKTLVSGNCKLRFGRNCSFRIQFPWENTRELVWCELARLHQELWESEIAPILVSTVGRFWQPTESAGAKVRKRAPILVTTARGVCSAAGSIGDRIRKERSPILVTAGSGIYRATESIGLWTRKRAPILVTSARKAGWTVQPFGGVTRKYHQY